MADYIPVAFFSLCKIFYKSPVEETDGILNSKLFLYMTSTVIALGQILFDLIKTGGERKTDYQSPTPNYSKQKFSQKYSRKNIFMTGTMSFKTRGGKKMFEIQ